MSLRERWKYSRFRPKNRTQAPQRPAWDRFRSTSSFPARTQAASRFAKTTTTFDRRDFNGRRVRDGNPRKRIERTRMQSEFGRAEGRSRAAENARYVWDTLAARQPQYSRALERMVREMPSRTGRTR